MEKYKNCAACGVLIVAKKCTKMYCSACRAERGRERSRQQSRLKWAATIDTKITKRTGLTRDMRTIEQLAAEARAAGMSYGQYVARIEAEREKEK